MTEKKEMNEPQLRAALAAGERWQDPQGDEWVLRGEDLGYIGDSSDGRFYSNSFVLVLSEKYTWFFERMCAPALKTEAQPDPMVPDSNGSNLKAKFGATKPSLGLIPASALAHEAMAFEDGASKYGPFSWRKDAPDVMTYMHAAKRHIDNFIDGELRTADTNVHNLGAARASLAIVIDAMECDNIIDNRPPPGPSSRVQEQLKQEKIAKAAKK